MLLVVFQVHFNIILLEYARTSTGVILQILPLPFLVLLAVLALLFVLFSLAVDVNNDDRQGSTAITLLLLNDLFPAGDDASVNDVVAHAVDVKILTATLCQILDRIP